MASAQDLALLATEVQRINSLIIGVNDRFDNVEGKIVVMEGKLTLQNENMDDKVKKLKEGKH